MAAQSRSRNQHTRTREDHATELAEDYVEAIAEIIAENGNCRVRDLVAFFEVTHVTINRTVARLVRDGWVKTEPYAPIELTKRGAKLAASCAARHEVVLNFLLAHGVSKRTATLDAEGIEHHVSPETLKMMQRYVEENFSE